VHERALSPPQQINFQDVHVCGTELAPFLTIFAQSRLSFVNWRKYLNTGHQAVVGSIADFDCGESYFNIQ
jgi:hypothetical protein